MRRAPTCPTPQPRCKVRRAWHAKWPPKAFATGGSCRPSDRGHGPVRLDGRGRALSGRGADPRLRALSGPEQGQSVRADEPVERNVPRIRRDEHLEPLKRPADADQLRPAPLQSSERSVIMALSAPEPRSGAVDCDQRHENEVRLHDRCRTLGLQDPERPGLQRVARSELERLRWVIERREGHDPADCPRFLDRELRADLGAQGSVPPTTAAPAHKEVR